MCSVTILTASTRYRLRSCGKVHYTLSIQSLFGGLGRKDGSGLILIFQTRFSLYFRLCIINTYIPFTLNELILSSIFPHSL